MRRPALALVLACAAAPVPAQHDHAAHAHHAPVPEDRDDGARHVHPAEHALLPPVTDADRAAAQLPADADPHAMHAAHRHHFVLFDRLESAVDGDGLRAWEASAWYGGDRHRLWLRSEGERGHRGTQGQAELLYWRPLTPWWDLLAGVRLDLGAGPDRGWAALGVAGLAPYRFEVDATLWVDRHGRTEAAIEVERETWLGQRLVLQSMLEARFSGGDDPARAVASGLSAIEAGLRLRWEIDRQFAPYVGLHHEQAHGGTARWRRAGGHPARETRIVAGFRFWF